MEKVKLSFIIPAYNEESYLSKCLTNITEEIQRYGSGIETEVIVVDNGSTDGTQSIARSFPNVSVVFEESKGASNARQKGFEKSSGDIVVFFDADTVIVPGWITHALRTFTDPEVVCVSGPYVYYDLPDFWKSVMRLRQITVSRMVHALFGHYVVAGNVAVRRSALLAIGGLDTSIPFYGDDADLGRRIREKGKVIYDIDLVVLSSARRYRNQGLLKTTVLYGLNFLSVAAIKRPVTKEYIDIR